MKIRWRRTRPKPEPADEPVTLKGGSVSGSARVDITSSASNLFEDVTVTDSARLNIRHVPRDEKR